MKKKVFVPYGEYIEQRINGAVELQGADVILANRLMKNHVKEITGLDGYGLITAAAIEAMDAEALVAAMMPHRESYEHFGEVTMRIWDLPSAWEEAWKKRRGATRDALRRLATLLEQALARKTAGSPRYLL